MSDGYRTRRTAAPAPATLSRRMALPSSSVWAWIVATTTTFPSPADVWIRIVPARFSTPKFWRSGPESSARRVRVASDAPATPTPAIAAARTARSPHLRRPPAVRAIPTRFDRSLMAPPPTRPRSHERGDGASPMTLDLPYAVADRNVPDPRRRL